MIYFKFKNEDNLEISFLFIIIILYIKIILKCYIEIYIKMLY